jgi:hypothetical protein
MGATAAYEFAHFLCLSTISYANFVFGSTANYRVLYFIFGKKLMVSCVTLCVLISVWLASSFTASIDCVSPESWTSKNCFGRGL